MLLITDGKGASWAFPGRTDKPMRMSESELDNTAWITYSVKEDSAGMDMLYGWIPSTYLQPTGIALGGFWGLREIQVVGIQTGGAQSTRKLLRMEITWEEAEVAAQTDDIAVWPNASTSDLNLEDS